MESEKRRRHDGRRLLSFIHWWCRWSWRVRRKHSSASDFTERAAVVGVEVDSGVARRVRVDELPLDPRVQERGRVVTRCILYRVVRILIDTVGGDCRAVAVYELGLKAGMAATVVIKASDVMIAVQ